MSYMSVSCLILILCHLIFNLGGHTAEMINLLAIMQLDKFKPRYYIAAATDNMSLQKARALENSLVNNVSYHWLL